MFSKILDRLWPISGFVEDLVSGLKYRPTEFAVHLDGRKVPVTYFHPDELQIVATEGPRKYHFPTIVMVDGELAGVRTLYRDSVDLNWREREALDKALDGWLDWFIKVNGIEVEGGLS